jgi:hypothetical protein
MFPCSKTSNVKMIACGFPLSHQVYVTIAIFGVNVYFVVFGAHPNAFLSRHLFLKFGKWLVWISQVTLRMWLSNKLKNY